MDSGCAVALGRNDRWSGDESRSMARTRRPGRAISVLRSASARGVADLWRACGAARRGSPAALKAFGLKPGDRVAIAAKNSPDYLETLYAIWHAGCRRAGQCQAARRRARLHPRTFRRAGLLRLRAGSTPRSRRMRRTGWSGSSSSAAPSIDRLFAADPVGADAARRQRSRLAVLHLGHHRPAEGRDADPSRAGGGERCLSQRGRPRSRPATRSCMRRR